MNRGNIKTNKYYSQLRFVTLKNLLNLELRLNCYVFVFSWIKESDKKACVDNIWKRNNDQLEKGAKETISAINWLVHVVARSVQTRGRQHNT